MLAHNHPSARRFATGLASAHGPVLCPVRSPRPPSAQSPFARRGRYPRRRGVTRRVGGRCPAFLAPTGSCAGPNPSRRLPLTLYGGSLQVVASPCWEMALPGVISDICAKELGPLPRPPLRCSCPFLPGGLRPRRSFQRLGASGISVALQLGRRVAISGLQSFRYVPAPPLARPPVCTYRRGLPPWAAGPYTPRYGRKVTLPNCGIARRLNRATGAAGLPPARCRPCRPLPKARATSPRTAPHGQPQRGTHPPGGVPDLDL